MDLPSIAEQAERPDVSTGHLPAAETVQQLVSDAHRRLKSNTDGQNSQIHPAQVSPALARVPSDLFGVCVVGTSGSVYAAGDTDREFSIMSVSKPLVFALVCETIGPEEARDKLGANAIGLIAGGAEGVASAVAGCRLRSHLNRRVGVEHAYAAHLVGSI
jgi:glutaminase